MKAILALEDGRWFEGQGFGAGHEVTGEIVFNTSMTGYQEVLTDPSYKGQIVVMTYPLIGNYGIIPEDHESIGPQAEGFVVREVSPVYSNWRADKGLDEYLVHHGIPGIARIDTRALTRHIRSQGAMRAYLCANATIPQPEEAIAKAKAAPYLSELDLVGQVTTPSSYQWEGPTDGSMPQHDLHVVAYDFGIKRNILRLLGQQVARITVVPAETSASTVASLQPDGLFLSNGPGDPARLTDIVRAVRELTHSLPTFGICLGHQILAQAFGARTYKLKFGHRGTNQPVQNLRSTHVEITSHNHGYAVDAKSLPAELRLTHINLYDRTVEGFEHRDLPVFAVQYHPEAAPGPHDAAYLFDQFVELMERAQ